MLNQTALYKTFNSFLKSKFGFPVYKIGLDAGFGCPHRTENREIGGCTYCNPGSFSPRSADPLKPVSEQIKNGIDFLKRRYKAKGFIAYFQSYTNTLASTDKLRRIYFEALECDEIVGLSIGTRPDCLSDKILDLIQEISQKTFLMMEIGLESSNDNTLKEINRGHMVNDFTSAMDNLKKRGIHTCAHVILGLPNEGLKDMIKTAAYLSKVRTDGVKIHHFHVVKGTAIEKDYYKGKIKTFRFEEYIPVVIKFLEYLNRKIIIHRLIGDCPQDLLVSPKWEFGKSQMLGSINNEMARMGSFQGKYFTDG